MVHKEVKSIMVENANKSLVIRNIWVPKGISFEESLKNHFGKNIPIRITTRKLGSWSRDDTANISKTTIMVMLDSYQEKEKNKGKNHQLAHK